MSSITSREISFSWKLPRTLVRWASYALVLLLPLSVYWPLGPSPAPNVLDLYVRPGIYLSDLAVGLLLLGGVFSPVKHRQWGKPNLTRPLIVLVGLAILTIPAALSPGLAGYMALRWVIALGVYLGLVQSDVPLERLVTVFLIGLGLQVLIGLGQVWLQGPLGLPGELALESAQSGAAIIPVGETRWLRAYGLTFHPNVLGGFLAVGLLLSLPLLRRRRVQFLWGLLGLGLLLTFSRSAWLATALTLPVAAGWSAWRHPPLRRPLKLILGGAGVALLLSGLLLSGQLKARLGQTSAPLEARSLVERGQLIEVALKVVADRPLTGVGAGNFPLAILRGSGTPLVPQPVHNVPLLFAAEIGVLGGGLWLWLWLAPSFGLAGLREGTDLWPVVLVSAWLALGIIALWDSYPWALNAGRLLSVTLLGLTSRVLQNRFGDGG